MAFKSSILVPTDFSEKSEIAIRYACEIAACTGAEILFMNVVEPPYDFPSRIEEVVAAKKKAAGENLTKIIDDLHSVDAFRFIRMKGKVEVGKVDSVILDVARSNKHDLICVGLGGEHDLKKALYGSVTNTLLLESPVPVFAISKRVDFRSPQQLVFATDLRKKDLKVIVKMESFAKDLGVQFRIINIVDDSNTDQHELETFTEDLIERTKNRSLTIEQYEGGSFLEGIIKLIGSDSRTILVTTRYKKTLLEWLFTKSNARVLATIAEVPLLLIPVD